MNPAGIEIEPDLGSDNATHAALSLPISVTAGGPSRFEMKAKR